MNIRRFVGASSREVMRLVREALGPDALIVSNRSVAGGIEVMAAEADMAMEHVSAQERAAGQAAPPAFAAASISERLAESVAAPVSAATHMPMQAPVRFSEPAVEADTPLANTELHEAISALRGAFETRIDGLMWGKGQAREPVGASLYRALLGAGFSNALARALLERLPKGLNAATALGWARNELISHLPVLDQDEDLWNEGGVFALVGPTGVGKTTTLAKLAARCVARVGRDQVAMLTTDNFRIGATEQLQIYGRLMGVPAHSVRDAAALRQALAELGDRKIILVDTTGISQRDRNVAQQAALLCAAGRPVRRLLVLNAASQGDTLDEVAHAYRNGAGEDVVGCIITKLDEASRLGAALDTAIRHRLPIHYVAQGQKVPEHLVLPRASDLIDTALESLSQEKNLYAPSESDMAAMWASCASAQGGDAARDTGKRRRMLAAALARPHLSGAVPQSEDELTRALAWLDAEPAVSTARSLWNRSQAEAVRPPLDHAAFLLDTSRKVFSTACSRGLLVLHGKAVLGAGATLFSSVLASDRGALLSAPAHRISNARGNFDTIAGGADHTDANSALAARCRHLSGQLGQLPHIHMLDGTANAVIQSLDEKTLSWIARVPSSARVRHDGYPTTVNAVGKSLGWVDIAMEDVPFTLTVDGQSVPVAVSAAGGEVALAGRHGTEKSMRLVCVRLLDIQSGAVLSQLHGLTRLPFTQADTAAVARALIQYESSRAVFRSMAHAWTSIAAGATAGASAGHMARAVLIAGQLGVAAWQIGQVPGAAALRECLAGVAGQSRQSLSTKMIPGALQRLFALLAMAD